MQTTATNDSGHVAGGKTEADTSATPLTDAVEGELLAEYGYCEAAFNNMANHARDLEREKAVLVKALQIIGSQSLSKDWTAEQAIAFVKQHARETRSKVGAA